MPRRLTLSLAVAIVLAAPAIAGGDEDIERTRICHPGFARAGRPSEAEWQRLKAEAMARAGLLEFSCGSCGLLGADGFAAGGGVAPLVEELPERCMPITKPRLKSG